MNNTRKVILASNWKMNLLPDDSKKYVEKLCSLIKNVSSSLDIRIYVPYTYIQLALKAAKNSRLKIGAQNCHFESFGAFTGEISTNMLTSLGVRTVIVGHSERRKHFFETDEIINKKIKKALDDGLSVVFCVGETTEEKASGSELKSVEAQISKGLKGVENKFAKNICIAYEPVWAIGTGRSAINSEINDMCKHIRKTVEKMFGEKASSLISIIYGGSLSSENIVEIIPQSDIDGGLIGGASLDADKFYEIINNVDKILKKEGNIQK